MGMEYDIAKGLIEDAKRCTARVRGAGWLDDRWGIGPAAEPADTSEYAPTQNRVTVLQSIADGVETVAEMRVNANSGYKIVTAMTVMGLCERSGNRATGYRYRITDAGRAMLETWGAE